MLLTYIRHVIFDHCIDTFFNALVQNFPSVQIEFLPEPPFRGGQVLYDEISEEFITIEYDEYADVIDVWAYCMTAEMWVSDNAMAKLIQYLND